MYPLQDCEAQWYHSPETKSNEEIKPVTITISQVQGNKQKRSKTKSVTFSRTVLVAEITHAKDYTETERLDTWYSKSERKSFKADIIAIGSMVVEKGYLCDEQYCVRGIESFCSRDFAKKQKQNKILAMCAVLEEQEKQYDSGNLDPEAISLAYQRVVILQSCSDEAFQRGKQDEIEARRGKCS
jgi:hypothetical protein